ncbi:right-handed parallel beta-helix repeat-containing protein [candidate division KSB1 bacterium]|nr:right-handed parallel beta-helix repeat-containing protein [candidate division KSB1 bacterium]
MLKRIYTKPIIWEHQAKNKLALLYFTMLIISFVIITRTFAAHIYHVSPDGNDQNPGTEDRPFKTIKYAAEKATAGDTVLVNDGIYREHIIIKNSGTSDTQRIVFKARTPHAAIVDGLGVDVPPFYGLLEIKNANYVTIEGFEIMNTPEAGVRCSNCKNATIRDCLIHNTTNEKRSGLIFVFGDSALIQHNEIYGFTWNGIDVEGGNNVIIESNYTHDNPNHFGLQIFPFHSGGDSSFYFNNIIRYNVIARNISGMFFRNNKYLQIYSNVIYNNTYSGIHLGEGATSSPSFDSFSQIYNNTIIGQKYCITNTAFNNLSIKNNIFYSPLYDVFLFDPDANTGHDIDYNLYFGKGDTPVGNHDLYADPMFVEPSKNNYELSDGSPAIDAGVILANVMKDINATLRYYGTSYDIGAYEYIPPTDTLAPAAPKGLRAIFLSK